MAGRSAAAPPRRRGVGLAAASAGAGDSWEAPARRCASFRSPPPVAPSRGEAGGARRRGGPTLPSARLGIPLSLATLRGSAGQREPPPSPMARFACPPLSLRKKPRFRRPCACLPAGGGAQKKPRRSGSESRLPAPLQMGVGGLGRVPPGLPRRGLARRWWEGARRALPAGKAR